MPNLPNEGEMGAVATLTYGTLLALAHQLLPRLEGIFLVAQPRGAERNQKEIRIHQIHRLQIMRVERKWLFVAAALIWGAPGAMITIKGLTAYGEVCTCDLWWHILISVAVLTGFYFMFRRVVRRYCTHILTQPTKASLWQTFPPRGWLLLGVMMMLGMAVGLLDCVPSWFVPSFYMGLGPMLLLSALRFLRAHFQHPPTKQ